ncbi:MAG: hypothetical protein GKR97_19985 [Rhizobiaceae bacterium]|nr:hypothetical protein [Rhizobiaceae bacterium]
MSDANPAATAVPAVAAAVAARPYGRSLSDFWLDGEVGKLHPAEHKLLACAAEGTDCNLAEARPERLTADSSVRADFFRFLALGGDAQNPVHEHGLNVQGAWITGDLDLEGTRLAHEFMLADCCLDGNIILRGCRAQTIGLMGTHVNALRADRLEISGSLHLRDGFCAHGEVQLPGAKLGGDLDCSHAVFQCKDVALIAQNAIISGNCILNDGFFANGTVNLDGASIGGRLSCRDGIFACRDQALFAPRIKVADNVNLGDNCRVAGQISLQGAVIGGDLSFTGGVFDRNVKWEKIHDVVCINLRNAEIGGTLFWRQIVLSRGELNLAGASCRTLNMDRDSWEKPAQIRLDNFTYRGFNQLDETTSARFWLNWIDRQPVSHLTTKFRPKPYQQLADVLQSMGHEEEARVIRIERRRRHAEYVRYYEKRPSDPVARFYRGLNSFWNSVQGKAVGYGYRPGNAVIWLVLLSFLGALFYQVAAINGIMAPTHPLIYKEAVWDGKTGPLIAPKIPAACHQNWVYPQGKTASLCARSVPSEYSTFNALIYSIDVAIPVVDFRMQEDWSPRVVDWQSGETDWAGWWVRSWEWLQILLGWAFSLLFVSAIGGIIRRD